MMIDQSFVKRFLVILLFVFAFQPAAAQELEVLRVPLAANALLYHDDLERLIAATPSTGSAIPNSIVLIDPVTGAIENSMFVGSDIRVLALSDNGVKLYAGLLGVNQVVKVDVPTLTVDTTFVLADGGAAPYFAEDIAVQPGNPDVIAVSLKNPEIIPKHVGVVLYDNGIAREVDTPGHTGSNVIEFGDFDNILYGFNNESTENGCRRMEVTEEGLTIISNNTKLISGYPNDIKFAGGRIYAIRGEVVAPEADTLLGRLPVLDQPGNPLQIEPDPSMGRTFGLQQISPNDVSIVSYDNNTFSRLANQQIEGIEITARNLKSASFVRWGSRGLAFNDPTGQIIIIKSALLDPSFTFIDFGPEELIFDDITTATSQPVMITNTGTADLVVDTVYTSHPEINFDLTSFTVAPGDSIEGFVSFAPSQYGRLNGKIQFISNSIGSPNSLPVLTDANVRSLAFNADTLAFGRVEVATSKELEFEIDNTGITNLSITSIQSNNSAFVVADTMVTVTRNRSLPVSVSFQPTAPGPQTGYITIESDAITARDSFLVTAEGVYLPQVMLNTNEVHLSDVRIGLERDTLFQVSNEGLGPLTVHQVKSSNSAFMPSPTSFELAPGASRDVTITIIATQLGLQESNIVIESDSPTSPDSLSISAFVAGGVSIASEVLPEAFSVGQNYPNPIATTSTTIPFALPAPSPVVLLVFDLLGRQVLTIEESFSSGHHALAIDVSQLPNGMYMYRLAVGDQKKSNIMTIMR